MKTFSILPWYFLLLIVGLCASVMVTTEGMTQEKSVMGTTPIDVLSAETSPAILIVVAQRNIGTTKVDDFKNAVGVKYPNMNIKVFNSTNDARTNEFLQIISTEKITATYGFVILKPNSAYNITKPNSDTNKPYISCKTELDL
jgi:hypothetical protein